MKLTINDRLPRRGLAFLAAALVVSLAGCGGGSGGGSTTNAASLDVEAQVGFDTDGLQERQSRIEAGISECMTAQGFEYVPIDPIAQRAAITGSSRLSDEDFRKQFGYGITTLYGKGTAQNNPNERIRGALSGADRTAYERALWGENTGATFSQAIEDGDFTRLGGCTKTATEAVYGGTQLLATLQGKLDELDQRIVQDQRMVRAIEQWAGCMNAAGYRYSDPQDVDEDLLNRFREIVPDAEPYATAAAPGTTYDKAALEALQRDEVAIVNADVGCEDKHITSVEDTVKAEYEAEFRQNNQALISSVPAVPK